MEILLDGHKNAEQSTNYRADRMRSRVGMAKNKGTEETKPTSDLDKPDSIADIQSKEKEDEITSIKEIPLNLLVPNPHQPRLDMDKESLYELAASIKEKGVIQAIVVSPISDGKYMIHFGHRRVEGSRLAGKETIRAIVKEGGTDDKSLIAEALIENMQRDDMHIIDVALSIRKAIDIGAYKNLSNLAKAIGKDLSQLSRILKILTLPEKILFDISKNKTITDRVVLDHLRKVEPELKCQEIYNWYVENRPSRDDFIKKLGEPVLSNAVNEKFSFKNTQKGCSIKTMMLTEIQETRLKDFLEKLLA